MRSNRALESASSSERIAPGQKSDKKRLPYSSVLPSFFPHLIFYLCNDVSSDSIRSFRRYLRHRDGFGGRGYAAKRLSGHRLGPECLSAYVHVSGRAKHSSDLGICRAEPGP